MSKVRRGLMATMTPEEQAKWRSERAKLAARKRYAQSTQPVAITATVAVPTTISHIETNVQVESKPVEVEAMETVTVTNGTGMGHVIAPNVWRYLPNKELETKILWDIRQGNNVLLVGPTGSGKTSSIYELAKRTGQKVLRCNFNGQTTYADVIGFWSLKGGETVWIDGLLPFAMKNGYWIILDEIDYGIAEILGALNSVLEKGCPLVLKEKGNEEVFPVEQFRIFATANSAGSQSIYKRFYQGTNNMNQALLDRFSMYEVPWVTEKDESKILKMNYPSLSDEMIGDLTRIASKFRASFLKGEFELPISPRRVFDLASRISNGMDFNDAFENVFKARVNKDQYDVIMSVVKKIHLKEEAV